MVAAPRTLLALALTALHGVAPFTVAPAARGDVARRTAVSGPDGAPHRGGWRRLPPAPACGANDKDVEEDEEEREVERPPSTATASRFAADESDCDGADDEDDDDAVAGSAHPSGQRLQNLTDQILGGDIAALSETDLHLVLDTWCRTCTPAGAATVEALLAALPPDRLTRHTAAAAVAAWALAGDVHRAQAALEAAHARAREHPHLAPMRRALRCILEVHMRAGRVNAGLAVLAEMEALPEPAQQPQTYDYNQLLMVLARDGAAAEAEALVKYMVDRCVRMEQAAEADELASSDCAPNVFSYYWLLDAHARSNHPRAGERATEILEALHDLAASGPGGGDAERDITPNARMYMAVMHAITRSSATPEDAVARIEALFRRAQAYGIRPDEYLYGLLLDAHANSRALNAAQRAEAVLQEMIADGIANDVAYNTVLKAWKASRHPDACERSLAILQYMEAHHMATRVSYTTVIGTLAGRGTEVAAQYANDILDNMQREFRNGNFDVEPDQRTFNSVLNAWVRCGQVRRAEQLLWTMENNQNDTAIAPPSVISYSTVMSGWSKKDEPYAWRRAEALLTRMMTRYRATGNEDLAPNSFTYASLICAYANSGDSRAAQEAEDTLKWMYKEYKAGRVELKPHGKLVTQVVEAYKISKREDAGQKAEALLDWILEKYRDTKDDDFAPDAAVFASVISAWGRSRDVDKAIRGRRILERMVELYESGEIVARPNTALFTNVINSCAFCGSDDAVKASSLRIAIQTYNELRRPKFPYGAPNSITYSSMLTALKYLLPAGKERSTAAIAIFNAAKETGYVDHKVMQRLFSFVSAKELEGTFPADVIYGRVPISELPGEWSRRIRRKC